MIWIIINRNINEIIIKQIKNEVIRKSDENKKKRWKQIYKRNNMEKV